MENDWPKRTFNTKAEALAYELGLKDYDTHIRKELKQWAK